MKILFAGTPDFAVLPFENIINSGFEVVGVVTQMDKPQGRKGILTPPPVKVCAEQHGIPVFQPKSMKNDDTFARLQETAPDVIVVVAYGKILPQRVLDLPRYGAINVHGSLLPRYRGAAPIQWAVLNGDTRAGITTMQMNAGLDTLRTKQEN